MAYATGAGPPNNDGLQAAGVKLCSLSFQRLNVSTVPAQCGKSKHSLESCYCREQVGRPKKLESEVSRGGRQPQSTQLLGDTACPQHPELPVLRCLL